MTSSIIIAGDPGLVATHITVPSTGRGYAVRRITGLQDPRTFVDPAVCGVYIFNAVGYGRWRDIRVPGNPGLQLLDAFLGQRSAADALRRTRIALAEDYPDRRLLIDVMTVRDETGSRSMEVACCTDAAVGDPRDTIGAFVDWTDGNVWRVTSDDDPEDTGVYLASDPGTAVRYCRNDAEQGRIWDLSRFVV